MPLAAQTATQRRSAARDNTRYDATFKKYSKRYFGIAFDWRRFKAQAMAESQLNPGAVSPVGARGLMQLMPSTFAAISSKRPEFASIDDPEWNIAAGIMHDRHLWKEWSKSIGEPNRPAFMYASYNAGQTTITRASELARKAQLDHTAWESIAQVAPTVPRWRYRETLGYVTKIDTLYKKLSTQR
ncbi:MAG TPA: transglycosylase SLT domain-containing protein [Gemmatimonadaceae bacterium]|nr:transglycosylase SLT domain-containing protein [Gemmatimonadaceae bacterium]